MSERKRIVAYFMHEHELAAAAELMPQADSTESFLVGEIDADNVDLLRQKGLIIQVLEEVPTEPVDELIASTHDIAIPKAGIEFAPEPVGAATDVFVVQLNGPILEPWRIALADTGARIMESIGPNRYTARLNPMQAGAVRSLNFVNRVHPYAQGIAEPTLTKGLGFETPPAVAAPPEMASYDIRLHEAADADQVLNWLRENHIAIAGAKGRKIRIGLLDGDPVLSTIGQLAGVSAVEKFDPPKLFNDRARVLLGVDTATNPVTTQFNETGAGQIVGVADTGLDDAHPDFTGRIAGISALGRQNDHSDPNGHGTHVAGSVLGDGSASGGQLKGTAPNARLFFQSILDSKGRLGGLPLDINDLFAEAYAVGARIHNNSWGVATASRYTFNSIEADEFVSKQRDMLIVIAAGNEGDSNPPLNAATGYVDWLSIGAPATSKNALTVGASRSDRTQGGYSKLTWGMAWPNEFPDAPIADEKISGDPESMAAFSSRGPCDDRRIKPDVIAPGTDIVSAKSSRAPLGKFWGAYPGHQGRYAYMGGTSMAAPLVSGCAALVREFYVNTRNHNPSAALLKATLVNGTRWLSGQDSTAEYNAPPNFHQGFGCVHMPSTIPSPAEPDLKLEFLDTWQDPGLQFTVTGQRARFVIGAKNARQLRFCLTWTDIPARSLQNNLNLFVEQEATGRKWVGNGDLPMHLNMPDADNNIEVIRIDNPQDGDYIIQISAYNLLSQSGQDFALVVTGDLTSQIAPY